MSEPRAEPWKDGKVCFKCAYNILHGSKATRRFKRDRSGAVSDPDFMRVMCDHNPDGKFIYGDACQTCDMFELDAERYHDLNIQKYEWDWLVKNRTGQMLLEDYL